MLLDETARTQVVTHLEHILRALTENNVNFLSWILLFDEGEKIELVETALTLADRKFSFLYQQVLLFLLGYLLESSTNRIDVNALKRGEWSLDPRLFSQVTTVKGLEVLEKWFELSPRIQSTTLRALIKRDKFNQQAVVMLFGSRNKYNKLARYLNNERSF